MNLRRFGNLENPPRSDLIDQGLQWKVTKMCLIAQFRVRSVYLDRVKAAQRRDPQLQKIMYDV